MVARYSNDILNVSAYVLVAIFIGISIYCMRMKKYGECLITIILQACIVYVIMINGDVIEGAEKSTLGGSFSSIGIESSEPFINYHCMCAANVCYEKSFTGTYYNENKLKEVLSSGCRALDFAVSYESKTGEPMVVCIKKNNKRRESINTERLSFVMDNVKKYGLYTEETPEIEVMNIKDPLIIILRIYSPNRENNNEKILGDDGILENTFGEFMKENDGVTYIKHRPDRSLFSLKNKVIVLVANEGEHHIRFKLRKRIYSEIMLYDVENYVDVNKGMHMHVHSCLNFGMVIPYDYQNEEKCNMITDILWNLGCQFIACDYSDMEDTCLKRYVDMFVDKGSAFMLRENTMCMGIGDLFWRHGYVSKVENKLKKLSGSKDELDLRLQENENNLNSMIEYNGKLEDNVYKDMENIKNNSEVEMRGLNSKINSISMKSDKNNENAVAYEKRSDELDNKIKTLETVQIGKSNDMSKNVNNNMTEINKMKENMSSLKYDMNELTNGLSKRMKISRK